MKNVICGACVMVMMCIALLSPCSAMDTAIVNTKKTGDSSSSLVSTVESKSPAQEAEESRAIQEINNNKAMAALQDPYSITSGLFQTLFNMADTATKSDMLPIASTHDDDYPTFKIVYGSGVEFTKETLRESVIYATIFGRHDHLLTLLERLHDTSDDVFYSSTVNDAFGKVDADTNYLPFVLATLIRTELVKSSTVQKMIHEHPVGDNSPGDDSPLDLLITRIADKTGEADLVPPDAMDAMLAPYFLRVLRLAKHLRRDSHD